MKLVAVVLVVVMLVIFPDVFAAVSLVSPADGSFQQGVVNFTFATDASYSELFFNSSIVYPYLSEGFTAYNQYKEGTLTDNKVLQDVSSGYPDSAQMFAPMVTYHDGQYRMYYTCKSDGGVWSICLANSTTPDSFTRYTAKMGIVNNTASSWHSVLTENAFVIDNCTGNGQTCMYVSGYNNTFPSGRWNIGLMLSDDNETWTPWSGNNCYASAGNGCVMTATIPADLYHVFYPNLVWGDGVLEMLYFGINVVDFQDNTKWKVLYANSTDGTTWTKASLPVLVPTTGTKWNLGVAPSRSNYRINGSYVGLITGKDSGEAGLSSDAFYYEATKLYDNSTWTIQPDEYVSNSRAWEGQEVEAMTSVFVDDMFYLYYDAWTSSPSSIGYLSISLDTWKSQANTTVQYVSHDFSSYPNGTTFVWNINATNDTTSIFSPENYTFIIGLAPEPPEPPEPPVQTTTRATINYLITFLLSLVLLMAATTYGINEMMKEKPDIETMLKVVLFILIMIYITSAAYISTFTW